MFYLATYLAGEKWWVDSDKEYVQMLFHGHRLPSVGTNTIPYPSFIRGEETTVEHRRGKISGVGGRNEGNEISAGRWTRIDAAAFTRANSGSDTTDAVSSRSNGRNEAENWPTFRHGRHLPPFNQNSKNRFVSLFSELP